MWPLIGHPISGAQEPFILYVSTKGLPCQLRAVVEETEQMRKILFYLRLGSVEESWQRSPGAPVGGMPQSESSGSHLPLLGVF